MGKLKNRPFEECVYKHCNNVFRPKREAQRFCSQQCRDAYRYDLNRVPALAAINAAEAEKGHERVKKARKRRLGQGHLEARKKGQKV
jgi:hypothetical protein